MANKQIMFDDSALIEMKKGVEALARAVKVTMGPTGRNVIIQKSYGGPSVTKDGLLAKFVQAVEAGDADLLDAHADLMRQIQDPADLEEVRAAYAAGRQAIEASQAKQTKSK